MEKHITDSEAVDLITEILREPDWDPGTLDRIAMIIEDTGRDVSIIEEEIED